MWQVTLVLEGQAPPRGCSRVGFVMGREHSGDSDVGIVAADGSSAVFYLGRSGEIAYLLAEASRPFQWLNQAHQRHPCGPPLQVRATLCRDGVPHVGYSPRVAAASPAPPLYQRGLQSICPRSGPSSCPILAVPPHRPRYPKP